MTLQESNTWYLTDVIFKTVINNTPLVSVDLIVQNNSKILLGERVNKPDQGYWFTLGGRVLKNETIQNAIQRIGKQELDIIINNSAKLIGVFNIYMTTVFLILFQRTILILLMR